MKKLFKWVAIPVIAIMSALSLSSYVSAGESGGGWCWGTLGDYKGIPTCDGAASNCTHPC